MSTSSFFLIALLHLMAILSPGPDVTLIIRNTIAKNRTQGFLTVLGIVTGIAIFLSATLLGFTQLIYENSNVFKVIAFISGLYLMYLGIKIIFPSYSQNSQDSEVNSDNDLKSTSKFQHPYVQGLITNLLNPKALLYFIGLFSRKEFQTHAIELALTLWLVSLLGFSTIVYLIGIDFLAQKVKIVLAKIEIAFGILMIVFSFQIIFYAFMIK